MKRRRSTYAILAGIALAVTGGLYVSLTAYPFHRDPTQSALLVAALLAVALVEIGLDNTSF